nr:MAG TPA: hypothetical protein [Caudoviricetes sp.]
MKYEKFVTGTRQRCPNSLEWVGGPNFCENPILLYNKKTQSINQLSYFTKNGPPRLFVAIPRKSPSHQNTSGPLFWPRPISESHESHLQH